MRHKNNRKAPWGWKLLPESTQTLSNRELLKLCGQATAHCPVSILQGTLEDRKTCTSQAFEQGGKKTWRFKILKFFPEVQLSWDGCVPLLLNSDWENSWLRHLFSVKFCSLQHKFICQLSLHCLPPSSTCLNLPDTSIMSLQRAAEHFYFKHLRISLRFLSASVKLYYHGYQALCFPSL